MNMIQNVWFDDAATSAMGKAFDNACKSLRNFGSAVPAIIADLIIAAAKNGERNPDRLYEQVLDDMASTIRRSWLLAWAAITPSQPMLRSRTRRDLKRARLIPLAGLSPRLHSHTWSIDFKTSINFETFWR